MKTKILIYAPVLISILLIFTTSACGRWMIKGQVVDAETGKSIEEAAVFIHWSKMGSGSPGLAGSVHVEVAEDLTDAEGFFKIPKYSTMFKDYDIAVYKKGYVCWSSRKIFPTFEERKYFDLKDGMVIKLEKFKEEYSKVRHAYFTTISATWSRGVFREAIKEEEKLRRKATKKKRKRRK